MHNSGADIAVRLPPPLPRCNRSTAHLLLHPSLQAFSLLGALGEVEDVEDVDADVLAPEPVAEEEAPRMPQRPKRVSVALWLASLARPGLPPVDAHSVHPAATVLAHLLLASSLFDVQPAAPPKPRPPPDVSDRLTLDDRKFTRLCVGPAGVLG